MNDSDEAPRSTPGATAPTPSDAPDFSVHRLVHEFRELAHDHLELATLEARLSINMLLRMLVVSLLTAILLASAWWAMVSAAAIGLINMGLAPVWALMLLGAANLLLALLGWLWTRRMSHGLGWPASLRVLKPATQSDVDERGP